VAYLYPKDREENIIYRDEVLRLADKDDAFRDLEKKKFFSDILYAFNVFFWTYDPRVPPHHLPFITYDFQDDAILEINQAIEDGEDLLIEKSRDMGVSWIVVSVFTWRWLKRESGNNTLVGSRKEDLVDKKGNLDTLLEKARYQIYKIPDWLVPTGFNPLKHDNHLQLYNPSNSNTIQGESTNEHFATGGRYRAVLFDEAAKWGELAEAAWISAGDSTPCRIAVSTPFGMGNHFAKLRFSKSIKVLSFHWTKHPIKSQGAYCDLVTRKVRSPWYDKECERRKATPLAIGQELDIDYVTSGSPAFSPEYIKIIKTRSEHEEKALKPYKLNVNSGFPVVSQIGNITIYRPPRKNCQYVIGADVAEGVGLGDFSAAIVLNRHTMDIDAVYHARSSPDTFAFELMTLGYMYAGCDPRKAALLAIESNTIGKGTVLRCDEENYPNLYYHVNEHLATKKQTMRLGWLTTRPTKLILVSEIENHLYNSMQFGYFIHINICEELLTFVVKGQKGSMLRYEADDGCHDDLVMALGITLAAHQTGGVVKRKKKEVIAPDVFPKMKEPTIHELCMATIKRRRMESQIDEHFGLDF